MMKWLRVYLIVTAGALVGMALGGVFGLGAGLLAPELFMHLIPWSDVEPLGAAIVCGAATGILLGGGLAVFALILQTVTTRRRKE
jgi:hypothetical protein